MSPHFIFFLCKPTMIYISKGKKISEKNRGKKPKEYLISVIPFSLTSSVLRVYSALVRATCLLTLKYSF